MTTSEPLRVDAGALTDAAAAMLEAAGCAVAEGFASVHFVNVLSRPLVTPLGGSDARLATDPFCVGVPHAPPPLILDFATSMAAVGQSRRRARRRQANGRGIADRREFSDPQGALLPFAQHKGFALAVMCELLGGALSGGQVQRETLHPNPMRNNMLSIVFAPDKLATCAHVLGVDAFDAHVAGRISDAAQ